MAMREAQDGLRPSGQRKVTPPQKLGPGSPIPGGGMEGDITVEAAPGSPGFTSGGLGIGRQVGSGGVIFEEGKKLADILGANAFPALVRVVLAATGQGIFEIGTIVTEDGSGVYYLANNTDFPTHNKGVGIVATKTNTGETAVPADQVSMEIFEAGSFQRQGLLQSATDPIPLDDLRNFLRVNGIYVEG
jgi:hypothetical protein